MQRLVPLTNNLAMPVAQPVAFSRQPGLLRVGLPQQLGVDEVRFGVNSNFERYRHKVQDGFKQAMTSFKIQDEVELVKDGKYVKVPRDFLDTPEFRRGANEGGVGQDQGESQQGQQVGEIGKDGEPQQTGDGDDQNKPGKPGQDGQDQAGNEKGGKEPQKSEQAGEDSGDALQDGLNIISLQDIYEELMKKHDFELPFEERGKNNIQKVEYKTKTISRYGPRDRIHTTRSFREAFKRETASQGDDFSIEDDGIRMRKGDFRYKDPVEIRTPKENAVIFYVMDTSGSQGKAEKDMARELNGWLSVVIQGKYGKINAELRDEPMKPEDFGEGVQEEHILHESRAFSVTQKEFYNESKTGGTKFSSAYEMILEKLKDGTYDPREWNIYVFHYTDGQNEGQDDPKALNMLKEMKELGVNRFGYVITSNGQAARGRFQTQMEQAFGKEDGFLRTSAISNRTPQSIERVLQDIIGPDKNKRKGRSSVVNAFA